MMPQREAGEPTQEQADSTYGRYEGNQASAQQEYESPYQHPFSAASPGKIYAQPHDNKNLYRLLIFAIAMVMLLVFAVLCLLIVGGSTGWISFGAACLAIFLIAVVAIDKIK